MDVTLFGIMVFLHPIIKLLDDVSTIALQLSRESYLGLPLSTLIEAKPLHPPKALLPIKVTLLGIVSKVMLLHPLNVSLSIDVILLGIFTDIRLLQ
jgi:hypothetical protein